MKAFLAVTFDSLRAPLTPAFKIPDSVAELADVHYFDSQDLEVPGIEHHIAGTKAKDMAYYFRGHFNRERMLKEFMVSDHEVLISLDSDSIIDDSFRELVDFEGAVRWAPYPFKAHFNSGYVLYGYERPCLTRFVTFGALVIDKGILNLLCPPYILNPDYHSDDFYFSRRLMDHGIVPWMVPQAVVGHQDRETGIIYYYDREGKVVGK